MARRWLIWGLLVASACKRGDAAALYEACYERCVRPPAGECQPGHDWCVQACRPGHAPGPRAVDATLSPTVSTKVGEFPMLLRHSVGLETMGGVFTPLLKQCTQLPAEFSEVFSTAADNQSQVQISILTGEEPKASANSPVGLFFLQEIPPAPRGVPQIRVTFRVRANGELAVTANDVATGRSQTVSVATGSPQEHSK